MKLFLASLAVTSKTAPEFFRLVGKPPEDVRLALIENAADGYADDAKDFVLQARTMLEKLGIAIDILDLKHYVGKAGDLETDLSRHDVVWFGGGNLYYLRYLLHANGFDEIIRRVIKKGMVYGGGSAGAILAGPTTDNYWLVDDPNQAPQVVAEGLGLTSAIIIPHWGNPKYAPKLERIKQLFDDSSRPVNILTDDQALIVINEKIRIIP